MHVGYEKGGTVKNIFNMKGSSDETKKEQEKRKIEKESLPER